MQNEMGVNEPMESWLTGIISRLLRRVLCGILSWILRLAVNWRDIKFNVGNTDVPSIVRGDARKVTSKLTKKKVEAKPLTPLPRS